MNIKEAKKYLQNNLNEWKEKRPAYGNSEIVEEVDNDYNAIETLLTAYEKEKEIIKNAICFLKYYNKDFNEMSDNEIKQILYSFGKCADIKKEE